MRIRRCPTARLPDGGVITQAEACQLYAMTAEELGAWRAGRVEVTKASKTLDAFAGKFTQIELGGGDMIKDRDARQKKTEYVQIGRPGEQGDALGFPALPPWLLRLVAWALR